MPVHIKNSDELGKMRVAGKLAAEVLELIEPYIICSLYTFPSPRDRIRSRMPFLA